jgi:cellulose biosynthesis protein BcsQ
MPLQLDTLSYTGLKGVLKFVSDVEAVHKHFPIRILGGVATMADARVKLAKHFEREIPLEAYRQPRMQTAGIPAGKFWLGTLRDRAEFPKAVFNHQTVFQLDGGSDASKGTRQIAEEIARRVHVYAHQHDRTGDSG